MQIFPLLSMAFINKDKEKSQRSCRYGSKPVFPLLLVGWSPMHYSLLQSDAMHDVAECVSSSDVATFSIIVSMF